jgi:hypothetical protein
MSDQYLCARTKRIVSADDSCFRRYRRGIPEFCSECRDSRILLYKSPKKPINRFADLDIISQDPVVKTKPQDPQKEYICIKEKKGVDAGDTCWELGDRWDIPAFCETCSKSKINPEYIKQQILNKSNRFSDLDLVSEDTQRLPLKQEEVRPMPQKDVKIYSLNSLDIEGFCTNPKNERGVIESGLPPFTHCRNCEEHVVNDKYKKYLSFKPKVVYFYDSSGLYKITDECIFCKYWDGPSYERVVKGIKKRINQTNKKDIYAVSNPSPATSQAHRNNNRFAEIDVV